MVTSGTHLRPMVADSVAHDIGRLPVLQFHFPFIAPVDEFPTPLPSTVNLFPLIEPSMMVWNCTARREQVPSSFLRMEKF